MKHLGDITKIHGDEIPVVDVITGGSPCQDLSVAGLRKGLKHGDLGDEEVTRSGLFMEQVRIVKEMRARDLRTGRSDDDVRCRWLIWENVPGALSSGTPKGADFAAVIEEIVKIVEPEAAPVLVPEKGWPKAGCFYDEMGRWSVAYRIVDAQYWGTPQRRKRIALVADLNGLLAPQVLFDPRIVRATEDGEPVEAVSHTGGGSRKIRSLSESVSGNLEPCGTAGEGTATTTESSTGGASGVVTKGNGEAFLTAEKHMSLSVGGGQAGQGYPCVLQTAEPILLESNQNHATIQTDGVSTALPASMGMGGGYVPMVVESEEPRAISFQERAGKPGGGKGILIQNERVGALSTLTNQMVYSATPQGADLYNGTITGDVAATLGANSGQSANHAGPAVCCSAAGFSFGQSAKARSLGYQEEMSPTLRGGEGSDSKPCILDARDQDVMSFAQNQIGEVRTSPVSGTLNTNSNATGRNAPLVYDSREPLCIEMTSTKNTVVDDGVSPTLTARMGTGGNQVNAVMETYQDVTGTPNPGAHPGSYNGQDAYNDMLITGCYQNTGQGWWNESEVGATVRTPCGGDSTKANLVTAVDCRNATENSEVNGTLQAKEQGQNLNSNNVCRVGATVRRLTPGECTALQGFPPGWVDIGDWVDTKGKLHKDSDSAKYKALGNSIAVGYANNQSGFWVWLMKRISATYERKATLGSLFDGIGGFPLAWSVVNGKESCLWASEIEEFPIAVTKFHFPEPEE